MLQSSVFVERLIFVNRQEDIRTIQEFQSVTKQMLVKFRSERQPTWPVESNLDFRIYIIPDFFM